jgi:hypothetical protein
MYTGEVVVTIYFENSNVRKVYWITLKTVSEVSDGRKYTGNTNEDVFEK